MQLRRDSIWTLLSIPKPSGSNRINRHSDKMECINESQVYTPSGREVICHSERSSSVTGVPKYGSSNSVHGIAANILQRSTISLMLSVSRLMSLPIPSHSKSQTNKMIPNDTTHCLGAAPASCIAPAPASRGCPAAQSLRIAKNEQQNRK